MHCWWIDIKKSPKYKLNDNIGDLLTNFWHHSNDTKRNPWVMCWHCIINDSSGCLYITVYLAAMLQASWHTAESKGSYIKSWCITKITHIWRKWGTPHNFLLALIDGLWKTQKLRILKKWKRKKILQILSFYKCVPKTTIRCSPWDTDWHNFFCHLGPFFAPPTIPLPILLHMCIINRGHIMYGSWDIKCKGQSLLSFWAVFLPFDPPNNPKNQNFEKIKKFLKIL